MAPIVWVLWRLATRYDKSGWWTFGWFLVLSAVERFVVEFVRRNPVWFGGLTQPQWVSVVSVDHRRALVLVYGKRPANASRRRRARPGGPRSARRPRPAGRVKT